MAQYTYNFPFSGSTGNTEFLADYSPFIVTFRPSNLVYGNDTVGKIIYNVNGVVTERNYTYSSLQEALSGSTTGIDSRSDFVTTFYNSISGATLNTVGITAIMIPSFNVINYNIVVQAINPWLSVNPLTASSLQGSKIFEDVHLIRSKSWGQDNKQLVVLEGTRLNTDTNVRRSQFVFLNSSDDIVVASAVVRVTPTPSITPTMTPTPTPTHH